MTDRPATWWSRELAILRAAVAAEEAGEDVAQAMAAASRALGLPVDQYKLIVRRFDDERLVDSAILPMASGKFEVHPRRVLPAGVSAAAEEPPLELAPVVTAEERRAVEVVVLQVRAAVEQADLKPDERADLEAQLESLEAQMRSPSPRRRIIGEILKTVRAVAENLVASGIWLGVGELLK
jgi:hypothetical protein